jgi:uncharacterized protein
MNGIADQIRDTHENGLDQIRDIRENGQMENRYLYDKILQLALNRGKMAFISGPRQVGKTTFSKQFENHFDQSIYKNWDETEFRRLWTKSPNQLEAQFDLTRENAKRLVILDEIHKAKGWKQKLKGLYDHFSKELRFIVTGSARLNVFRRGGDSLMGRYLHFRLHPFSYGEVTEKKSLTPDDWISQLYTSSKTSLPQEPLERLLRFSGFPEPFLSGDAKILNLWSRGRTEKIIREDLRDLSRLPELSQVEMLVSLLSAKVGSPLSVQSLREDLEVAHDTVKRWLLYLNELYYFFEIRPWTKSVGRTLKKEPKLYLYDWTEIDESGPRYENMLAVHLQKACDYWTDIGEGAFELFYLRNKEKQEIDFLIARNKKPWIAIEAKYSDKTIQHQAIDKLTSRLSCKFAQVVFEEGIYRNQNGRLLVSANRFLSGLP